MRPAFLLSATALLLSLGCSAGPTSPGNPSNPNNPDPTPGEGGNYLISIGDSLSSEMRILDGTGGVSTSWEPNAGLIYLGAAPLTGRPVGTLTLRIGAIQTGSDGTQHAAVVGGTASSSRRAEGTVDVVHAITYTIPTATIGVDSITVGSTFIEGRLKFDMTSIPTQVDPDAETFPVTGHFRAVSGNP